MVEFGTLLLTLGTFLGLVYFNDWRRVRKILRVPLVPIASASVNQLVRIEGRVVGAEGTLTSPFTGSPVVVLRIAAERKRDKPFGGRGSRQEWDVTYEETSSTPFVLSDGSGRTARINADGAALELDYREIPSADASPALPPFLASRGLTLAPFLGARCKEVTIRPGDSVLVVGRPQAASSTDAEISFSGSDASNRLTIMRPEAEMRGSVGSGIGCACALLALGLACIGAPPLLRLLTIKFAGH